MSESDSDDDLFRQAMGDVKPIKSEARVKLEKKASEAATALEARRQAAVAQAADKGPGLSGDFVHPVDPHDILEFKRPGIQHGVYKNLRLGKYSVDAQLDLHRMSVEQARAAVAQFINDCLAHNIRCALINHGKGENRQPRAALLKSCVAHWLPQLDAVMAYHSAQRQHGGSGATYVLLKKSEKKRQENFERHQKRR
ncbi:DNA endonuclease SmrA [Gilvimarinus sp. F26214L]|uniref:DNA endonuclease SmrA n=1 Tax=Gilvimarinus sp. DZF01 TaxID=3461371 RepID=UPI004045781D